MLLGATATLGMTAQAIPAAGKNKKNKEKKKKKVIYRTLGNTGMEVPIISMGVMRSEERRVGKEC